MTLRRSLNVSLSLLSALTLTVFGLAASPRAQGAASTVKMTVAAEDGGVLGTRRYASIDVSIENLSTSPLSAGSLTFSIQSSPVASSIELSNEYQSEASALLGYLLPVQAKVPAIEPNHTVLVRTRIPVARIRSIITAASGARILYSRYLDASGQVQVIGKTALTLMSPGANSLAISTLIPITAPTSRTGLTNIAMQESATAAGGTWTQGLKAALADPSATIALDPSVIASIRLAGSQAPSSATAFLARLSSLPNTFMRLPYADADVTLERAAGLGSIIQPQSLEGSIGALTTSTLTPNSVPPGSSNPLSIDEATAWKWSGTEMIWPLPGTVVADDLKRAQTKNYAVLLGSRDIEDTAARRLSGVRAQIDATSAAIADSTASDLLGRATASGITGAAAATRLLATLSTLAATRETPSLLLTAPRIGSNFSETGVFKTLNEQPWLRGVSIEDIPKPRDTTPVRLAKGAVSADRLEVARRLLAYDREVADLAAAARNNREQVLAPRRLALAGMFSCAWQNQVSPWKEAALAFGRASEGVTEKVQIDRGSLTNIIGTDGSLAVVVSNRLSYAVRVGVAAEVSNASLQFSSENSPMLTVPPNSRARVNLMFRSISNGRSVVTLSLKSPTGDVIGSPVARQVNVQAGFDTVVALILLGALSMLLGLGIYRNVNRYRKPR